MLAAKATTSTIIRAQISASERDVLNLLVAKTGETISTMVRRLLREEARREHIER